ncbi:MAG: S9 family peptidase [Odoribacter sp.]|nr:S9 family peptidase [Odoribacter sp.]
MKNKTLLLIATLCMAFTTYAEKIDVNRVRYAGPFTIQKPIMVDEVDVNSRPFSEESFMNSELALTNLDGAELQAINSIPACNAEYAIHLIGFTIENNEYAKVRININGIKGHRMFVNGKMQRGGELTLEPATHEIVIKYMTKGEANSPISISLESPKDGAFIVREDGKRLYTINDVLHNKRMAGSALSPNGKYMIVSYSINRAGGQSSSQSKIINTATGETVTHLAGRASWMPRSNKYYYNREGANGSELIVVNPETLEEEIFATNVPRGSFRIAPNEQFFVYSINQQGPREREDIYEVIHPADRAPGWRNRSNIAIYDLKSGMMQQLTFGHHNTRAMDISADSRYLLVSTGRHDVTQRPSTNSTVYILDLQTRKCDTLINQDQFINGGVFSPCGTKVLFSGSPEALNGIAKKVKEGQTPSLSERELYIMDIATKQVTPITKDFNPCIQAHTWNPYDNQIYFAAEDKDKVSLFRLNPESGKIQNLNIPEELAMSFSMARTAPMMAFYGQGSSNSDRLYTLNTKKMSYTLVEDLSAETLKDIELGQCIPWNFVNRQGDTIYGRYYLPPHFDANKKYPMIVNYYGGCSPTSCNFESRYPHHAYAAQGYIVYVVNPSGATGFGQEFSARHVNTAGEGVAQDIIEGTTKFADEHQFVNRDKIGCIGASYGGFMSQYLQVKSDIFATAISHAGISDHTSYWGEGYWGYSYSEVSMANSYPWSNKELYVERSPLFNADKINTPILFLHGDSDVNVPVGESIQMYIALKRLGKETAMVLVKDQDHHILDYNKRIRWQNTIYAWFARFLKDDPTWWHSMYAPKSL